MSLIDLGCDTDTSALPARHGSGSGRLLAIADLDQRTRAAKSAAKLVLDLESDFGGATELSVAERVLIQRAALLGAMCEDHEARWLSQAKTDLSLYGTLVDRQRRILEALGLRRRQKDVTGEILDKIREGAV